MLWFLLSGILLPLAYQTADYHGKINTELTNGHLNKLEDPELFSRLESFKENPFNVSILLLGKVSKLKNITRDLHLNETTFKLEPRPLELSWPSTKGHYVIQLDTQMKYQDLVNWSEESPKLDPLAGYIKEYSIVIKPWIQDTDTESTKKNDTSAKELVSYNDTVRLFSIAQQLLSSAFSHWMPFEVRLENNTIYCVREENNRQCRDGDHDKSGVVVYALFERNKRVLQYFSGKKIHKKELVSVFNETLSALNTVLSSLTDNNDKDLVHSVLHDALFFQDYLNDQVAEGGIENLDLVDYIEVIEGVLPKTVKKKKFSLKKTLKKIKNKIKSSLGSYSNEIKGTIPFILDFLPDTVSSLSPIPFMDLFDEYTDTVPLWAASDDFRLKERKGDWANFVAVDHGGNNLSTLPVDDWLFDVQGNFTKEQIHFHSKNILIQTNETIYTKWRFIGGQKTRYCYLNGKKFFAFPHEVDMTLLISEDSELYCVATKFDFNITLSSPAFIEYPNHGTVEKLGIHHYRLKNVEEFTLFSFNKKNKRNFYDPPERKTIKLLK